MRAALLCLCLLGAALPTPVPLPPARASGNCAGQHRILLRGCNTKHGFYVFKYVYSFSTRRNQTQIKKEEAGEQSPVPSHRPGEEDGEATGRGVGGSYVLEDGYSPEPENRSTLGSVGESRAPHLGPGTRVGPTLAGSEGSGDAAPVLAEEANGGEDVLLQSTRPGGPRGDGDGGDGGDGAAWGVLVDGAVTGGLERVPATRGAGDEGSGEATAPGRGQAGVTRVTGTGGTAVSSVTQKEEDVRVDAEGVDAFAYVPEAGTGVTRVSPEDEVKIFIGRADIRVGERDVAPGSTRASSEDVVVPTVGTAGSWGPATTGVGDRATSSLGGGRPAGADGADATVVPSGQGVVAPIPAGSISGDIAVTAVVGGHGGDGGKVRGEGQRPGGRPVLTTGGAGGPASPGLTTGDCSTAGTPAGHASSVAGPGGSGEVGTTSPARDRDRARPEGARLGEAARTEAALSPSGAGWRPGPGRAHAGDAAGVPGAPRLRGSPRPRAQRPGGSKASVSVSASASAGGFVRPRGGRRLGSLAALERSRQLDQVRRADELHLRERALYRLGGAGGGPPVPPGAHRGLWSADSSQSSEGERGSRSGSGEEDGLGGRREAAGFHHGPSVPL